MTDREGADAPLRGVFHAVDQESTDTNRWSIPAVFVCRIIARPVDPVDDVVPVRRNGDVNQIFDRRWIVVAVAIERACGPEKFGVRISTTVKVDPEDPTRVMFTIESKFSLEVRRAVVLVLETCEIPLDRIFGALADVALRMLHPGRLVPWIENLFIIHVTSFSERTYLHHHVFGRLASIDRHRTLIFYDKNDIRGAGGVCMLRAVARMGFWECTGENRTSR